VSRAALSTLNGMSGTFSRRGRAIVGELVALSVTRRLPRDLVPQWEEALVELERHPIRLVLLDIGLPGKDGFDVCREIRARSYVPILMLTARDGGAGPDRRARGRGRRLHHEAVLAARARRAP